MSVVPRPIDLLNGRAGLGGLAITRAVAFGAHPRHRLDVYRPARRPRQALGPLPVIVFFYGGSWQTGARAEYAFVAARLARRGFVVAVPDYRLFPEAVFPAFLEDAALAVAWISSHAVAFGGNPDELFLIGHSAGAYNAVMLALAPEYLQAAGLEASRLKGVIGLAGPYDFLPLGSGALRRIFAHGNDVARTQPINLARGDAPPLFLLTGAADTSVLPRNSTALAARSRALGGVVETRIYPKLGHVGIILAVLALLRWRAPVMRDMLAFIAACRAGEYAATHSGASERMIG